VYKEEQPQRPQTETPSVYRYEVDGQVAYHKKSSRGETFIFAPLGSVEAQTMDAVAQRRGRGTAVAPYVRSHDMRFWILIYIYIYEYREIVVVKRR
jgi:hypothetical protein